MSSAEKPADGGKAQAKDPLKLEVEDGEADDKNWTLVSRNKKVKKQGLGTLMPGTIHQNLSTFKPSAMGGPKDWIPSYLSKVTPGIYDLALVDLFMFNLIY